MARTKSLALPSASSLVLIAVFGFVGMMAAVVASVAVVTPIVRGQMSAIALQQQQIRPVSGLTSEEVSQQPTGQTVSSCVSSPGEEAVTQIGAEEENVPENQPPHHHKRVTHMNMNEEEFKHLMFNKNVTNTTTNNTNNTYSSVVTNNEHSNNVINSNNSKEVKTKTTNFYKNSNNTYDTNVDVKIAKNSFNTDSHNKYVAKDSFNTDITKDSYNTTDSNNSWKDDHSTTTTETTKTVVANNQIASNNSLTDDHSQTETTNNTEINNTNEVNNEVKDSYNTASNNELNLDVQSSNKQNDHEKAYAS